MLKVGGTVRFLSGRGGRRLMTSSLAGPGAVCWAAEHEHKRHIVLFLAGNDGTDRGFHSIDPGTHINTVIGGSLPLTLSSYTFIRHMDSPEILARNREWERQSFSEFSAIQCHEWRPYELPCLVTRV